MCRLNEDIDIYYASYVIKNIEEKYDTIFENGAKSKTSI